MPDRYAAGDRDVSPPLTWGEPPAGTASFALICEDPDAPSGSFVHWMLWNIDPIEQSLPEGVPEEGGVDGLFQGRNDFGEVGYRGPATPPGPPHRYVFRLYALDAWLDLQVGASRMELERAIEGHILAEGVLVGRHGR